MHKHKKWPLATGEPMEWDMGSSCKGKDNWTRVNKYVVDRYICFVDNVETIIKGNY